MTGQPAPVSPRPARRGRVVPLRPAGGAAPVGDNDGRGEHDGQSELEAAGAAAWAALERHLDRCALAAATVRAYRRQARAYLDWLAEHPGEHPDAFADLVGAEAAVTAWRRHLLGRRAAPASVGQALAAVELLYAQPHAQGPAIRVAVSRPRVPRPGEPDALDPRQDAAVQRAADRRGARDAAIIALLRYTGARVEEAARLELDDLAITARTGTVRLHGKGDQVRTVPIPAPARDRISTWLDRRATHPRAADAGLWLGQRGRLSISGIRDVVLAAGADADLPGLRPHRLRHTYATRLRQGGADPAQIQALMGHASLNTTARCFRAGPAEVASVVDRIFQP